MRKGLLLTAICAFSTMMTWAQINAAYPDEAEYFIKGRVSVEKNPNGGVDYKLYDVTSKGISFEQYPYYWGREDGESIYFTLNRAKTDYPGGFESGLTFWRYDEDIQQWQTDSEFKPSTADFEETKQMAVMVLIDCSTSLGEEWSVAKESAINFIDLMHGISRGRGNIKIGIIGFSSIGATKTFDMQPLNDRTKEQMRNFIRYDLKQEDGTALFYAMDKAVEMMENYCRRNINTSDLAVSSMAIFTDGLDQISRNLDKNILTTDEYRNYVKQLKDKKIGNTTMYSTMFGLKGIDITTEAQWQKFRRIGEEQTDKFVELKDIYQLDKAFSDFAKDLTDAWQNLKCYAPNSYRGRVAWTFRNTGKQMVVEKPKEPRKKGRFFFGINAGLGFSNFYRIDYEHYQNEYGGSVYVDNNYRDDIGLAFSGGIDLAFPISRAVNLGLFGSIGFETASESIMFNAGPLLLINFKNNSSLYLGGGASMMDFENIGLDLRAGFKFKNGLYLFGELFSISYNWSQEQSFYIIDGYNYNYYNGYEEYGHYSYYTDTSDRSLTGFLIHIGYSF